MCPAVYWRFYRVRRLCRSLARVTPSYTFLRGAISVTTSRDGVDLARERDSATCECPWYIKRRNRKEKKEKRKKKKEKTAVSAASDAAAVSAASDAAAVSAASDAAAVSAASDADRPHVLRFVTGAQQRKTSQSDISFQFAPDCPRSSQRWLTTAKRRLRCAS